MEMNEWLDLESLQSQGIAKKEPFGHGFAFRVDPKVGEELQQFVLLQMQRLIGEQSTPGLLVQLPGIQPASILRAQMAQLLSEKYFVTEKSDGLRHWMMFLAYEGKLFTCLIDRTLKIYLLPPDGLYIPESFVTMYCGSILDGELCRVRNTNKYCFLVFDAVVINRHLLLHTLSYRYRQVLVPLFQGTKSMASSSLEGIRTIPKKSPFLLALKSHYPLSQLQDVYRKAKRNFQIDGLIFTPDSLPPHISRQDRLSMRSGHQDKLLKWKPREQNTVDVLCQVEEIHEEEKQNIKTVALVHLFVSQSPDAATGERKLVWYKTLTPEQVFPNMSQKQEEEEEEEEQDNKEELSRNESESLPNYTKMTPLQRARKCHGAIIEVSFKETKEDMILVFVKRRKDKIHPNTKRTVELTERNFEESITLKELTEFLQHEHHVLES